MISKQEERHELPEGLSNPARGALLAEGIQHLEDLSAYTEKQILAIHGVGPKTIPTLREAMGKHGISFADESR